ncbi:MULTISPECIES: hypothetical protein [unclassified Rhizobium]|uniref:hypothetical protein n=1 Tax=unclassified Rhizobium TaxID=2613769 RepID=UPI000712CF13|nr:MULTISPECIES: hypothetical protein [unclassified Rhizobium]KQT03178.1 hypothetical protein ASG42_24520 [Rhizobium sp. Leaf391]KQU08427.1 hypothetical protein ASG68_22840 [Rhizobium sp. Leaf453]
MTASPAIYQFRRQELERWIDNAIALLDHLDGDPDLEDDDREETMDEDSHLCGRLKLIGVPSR